MSDSFVRRVERTLITILVILISIMILNIATSCNTKSLEHDIQISTKESVIYVLADKYDRECDEILESYMSGIYSKELTGTLLELKRHLYKINIERLLNEIDSINSLYHKK